MRFTRKKLWIIGSLTAFLLVAAGITALVLIQLAAEGYFVDRRVELPAPTEANLRELLKQTQDELVYVQGGRFMMCEDPKRLRPEREEGGLYRDYYKCNKKIDDTAHPVELTSYHISAYETTYAEQDLWAAFNDRKPILPRSAHTDSRSPKRPAGTRSWYEARDYCRWLHKLTGLDFHLPTEAQWEYAARSRGRPVPYATANGNWQNPDMSSPPDWRKGMLFSLKNVGPKQDRPPKPLPVGTFPPNPLGLYDMSGNVREWVKDWYGDDYYKRSPVKNPQGPADGKRKILRGGAYEQSAAANNTYGRYPNKPTADPRTPTTPSPDFSEIGFRDEGFRCALNLDRKLKPGELVERAVERGHLSGK